MSELWPGGPEYAFAGAFPVTTDSVLLADFARIRPGSRVLELCCGAGLISLLLMARAPGLDVLAVSWTRPRRRSPARTLPPTA